VNRPSVTGDANNFTMALAIEIRCSGALSVITEIGEQPRFTFESEWLQCRRRDGDLSRQPELLGGGEHVVDQNRHTVTTVENRRCDGRPVPAGATHPDLSGGQLVQAAGKLVDRNVDGLRQAAFLELIVVADVEMYRQVCR
jgi:hypothetical protein